jgi:predicted PurR-regulated permease PerM
VAAIQALLIGVGLLVAGVPAAGLLTMAVLVLAILQIGSGPVVLPLLIWAWIQMPTPQALLLTAYMVPVSLIDNVLKPLLMGKGLPTPMLVILMGVIGGTISYGLIGLFLGPIVLAVFYELVVYWVAAERPAAVPPAAPGGSGRVA